MSIKKAKPFDFTRPFGHAELLAALRALEEEYPFLEFGYLGTSVLERGIPLVKIGNGRRKLLYVGGHRGTEWVTSLLLTRFLQELAYAAQRNACIGHLHYRSVFETHTIFTVPMLNPDGIEYLLHGTGEDNPLRDRVTLMNQGSSDLSHWKANARGVDLCHNYSTGFEEYRERMAANGTSEGAPEGYAGQTSESEPEVHALCNLIRYHEDLLGVMTLHAQGREIRFQCDTSASAREMRIANRLSRMTSYRLAPTEESIACGRLSDWCIQERKLAAFAIQCDCDGKDPRAAFIAYTELREALFTFPILL